ncbi:hypothetical protein I3760_05G153300 [Carya illinoinensis]|nr:hypothetical protein I3760_05G153300 [Carya illinoinensis]
MGETEVSKTTVGVHQNKGNGPFKAFDSAFSALFVQLPHTLQNCLMSRFQRLAKDMEGVKLGTPALRKEKGSSTPWEVDLEKQMLAWSENPSWVDDQPPKIKEVISRKVLVDEGLRQVVELEQAALWRFLWWSGTISVHVLVDQNREDHSMKFKQVKTGFMKKFEGCWTVDPVFVDEKICFPLKPKTWKDYFACTGGKGRVGSKVSLEQLIQPALVPPPPISWYLRGITSRTTEMLINDLLAEAARIRGDFCPEKSGKELETSKEKFDECLAHNNMCDIKERWALHRRNAKQGQRRLLTAN